MADLPSIGGGAGIVALVAAVGTQLSKAFGTDRRIKALEHTQRGNVSSIRCDERHAELKEDLGEVKADQKASRESLTELRVLAKLTAAKIDWMANGRSGRYPGRPEDAG